MATAKIAEIKAGLVELKDLEDRLSSAKWQETPSPRGVDDALLQRYVAARDLYLKRRTASMFVDHVKTFDPSSGTFDMPDVDDSDDESRERHAKALSNLETTLQLIRSQVTNLRDGYTTIQSRREDLERHLQDMEQEDGDTSMDEGDDDADDHEINDQDMEAEQERIEELEKTKRRLEEELASLQKQNAEVQERTRAKEEDIARLELEVDGDGEDFKKKLDELREMKQFYDSMRVLIEELGGVKIESVEEDPTNLHLLLKLILYDEYKVEIELQVYRRGLLKLVNAKWISNPVVGDEKFSLPLAPLDDLVQVAKTTFGPPHDVQFMIRETLARLRIQRERVKDLVILRQSVLTQVGGDQVVCGLNEGIVVEMRLYEDWVRVERIVGVSGWDSEATEKIKASLVIDEHSTPSSVIKQVQDAMQRLQEEGLVKTGTPTMPKRGEGTNDNNST